MLILPILNKQRDHFDLRGHFDHRDHFDQHDHFGQPDHFNQRDHFDHLGHFFTFYCDQYFARAYRLEVFSVLFL